MVDLCVFLLAGYYSDPTILGSRAWCWALGFHRRLRPRRHHLGSNEAREPGMLIVIVMT
jgi:hypothetical protein